MSPLTVNVQGRMNESQDEEVMAMSSILPEAFTFSRAQNRGRLTIKPGNMLSKCLCSPAKDKSQSE
jgi:hypothetical protein